MPSSFRFGTSGQFLVRSPPQVTSNRKSPESTSARQPVESATASTCPPRSAALVSAAPLNGTCVHFAPVCLAICSTPVCRLVPVPGVPYLILPGLALAYSTSSLNVFQGDLLCTTTPNV